MDEMENNEKMQEQAQTQQNTKEALRAAEKGVAAAYGGAAGVAAVNTLHNTPGLGKALDKVEDKAAEKLGKNKNMAKLANNLKESGATDAANTGLDALGSTSGGASKLGGGASSASQAGGLPENSLNSLPKDDLGSEGKGQASSFSSPKTPDNKNAKTMKILKIVAMASPFLLIIFMFLFLMIVIMSQIMVINDKIKKVGDGIVSSTEKMNNFLSGDGWNTDEDLFFKELKNSYNNYKGKAGSEKLDIPLIAATIHYSKVTDIDVWDGENGENDSLVGNADDFNGTFDFSDSSNSIVESYQMKSFYKVANEKLGTMGTMLPGERGLLGHLVAPVISKRTFTINSEEDKEEVKEAWEEFFQRVFNFLNTENVSSDNSTNKFENAFNSFKSSLDLDTLTGQSFRKFSEDVANFKNEGISFIDWKSLSIAYETDELKNYVDGEFNDERLSNTKYSYYSNLEGTGIDEDGESLSLQGFFEQYEAAKRSTVNDGKVVNVPSIEYVMDYKAYYRYLVDVYIPITFFPNQKLDEDFTYTEVINMANEIFDQKYAYDDLFDEEEEDSSSNCEFVFGSTSSEPVTIDKNMIDNLYVEVMSENCSKISTCDVVEETVSLKDYVIGVVYREFGASVKDNQEYLKAAIIAVKSYAVGRRPATYSGGRYVTRLLNTTNDQTYCSLTKGCMESDKNKKPVPSAEYVALMSGLYDQVYNEFLYDSSAKKFVGSYRDTLARCIEQGHTGVCLGQKDSKVLGESGKSYQGILTSFYYDPIGLVDISTGTFSLAVNQCISTGLQLGTNGYYVRTSAPLPSDIYYNPPYVSNSNLGQCVWYVKARATEIIANSKAPEEKKEIAMQTLLGARGNGNQWYNERLQAVFGSSSDYRYPRAGAIAVYDWTDSRCRDYWNGPCEVKYGHSIIIEAVEGDIVTITDGYNKCSGGTPTWNCFAFNGARKFTIEQLKDLGGKGYIFIGYIYLLD